MPRAWNKASLENVEVGENEVSAYYSKLEGVLDIEVTQVKNWELELVLTDMAASEYEFSPKNAKVSTENGNLIIRGASDKLKISVKTD
jgi:chaperonin cofactor prefoldin